MPEFTAPISVDRSRYVDVYALSIEAPESRGKLAPPLTAYIVPKSAGCCISEALAKEFDDSVEEGDLLILTMIEAKESGVVHRYPLVVPIQYVATERPDYVEISLNHIQFMFSVAEYEPQSGEHAEARRLNLSLRRCIETPGEPPDEQPYVVV